MQTPGVLLGYDYGSTVYTRPVWVKTKQDTLGDLIRPAVPQRSAALSHSLVCVNESAGDVQGCFFFFSFAEFSGLRWSAVLEDSCCDCRVKVKPKALNSV